MRLGALEHLFLDASEGVVDTVEEVEVGGD